MSKADAIVPHEGALPPRTPLLSVKGVSKSFPGVKALSTVSFDLYAGEVHALCGENGAGKSTLMKILAGAYIPDSGEIRFQGEACRFASVLDARKRGILLIHQEVSLVNELSVAENLFMGSLPAHNGWILDRPTLFTQAQNVLDSCGYPIDARRIVGSLSIAQQQMVELARAEAFQCRIVIFDEPTASLTDKEAEALFANIQKLKSRNVAIVYISHKMKEIFAVSDRITVLRDGQTRATVSTQETSEAEVTKLMIGRELSNVRSLKSVALGETIFRIVDVSVEGHVKNASFALRKGEILGLYGLVGAGRSELVEAIFGVRPISSGEILVGERPVRIRSPRDAIKFNIGLVPEDRKMQGLVLGMGCSDSVALTVLPTLSRFGLTRPVKEQTIYSEYKDKLNIKAPNGRIAVGTLSGGNQQKVVIAKWLAIKPDVLILDEPTRGIDVGAKAEIYELIHALAAQGIAILLISSELPEILTLSSRVITMYHGEISGEFDGSKATEDILLSAAMGSMRPEAPRFMNSLN
jgi:ribose transport system ATP-binding protein